MNLINKKTILLQMITIGMILSGCSSAPKKSTPERKESVEYINHIVLDELKASSESVQGSLKALNQVMLARYGNPNIPFQNIDDKRLNQILSLSFYGPIEEVVKKVAKATGYKMQIFGKKPPFSIIVILGNLNKPIHDSAINILRNIAIQSAKQATLEINPRANVISIRYVEF
ncbi:DotD/TraH family lipoprotein [Fangia hongkongensis]|nr:DotD/TraH family lipoprotein [Fangia hongkongensis]